MYSETLQSLLVVCVICFWRLLIYYAFCLFLVIVTHLNGLPRIHDLRSLPGDSPPPLHLPQTPVRAQVRVIRLKLPHPINPRVLCRLHHKIHVGLFLSFCLMSLSWITAYIVISWSSPSPTSDCFLYAFTNLFNISSYYWLFLEGKDPPYYQYLEI